MEIVNIEKRAIEQIVVKFESLAQRVEQICHYGGDKSLKDWLDNHEVCSVLQISLRTLQSYRDKGLIGYTQIGHKIYYRSEDVRKLLNGAS